MRRQEVNQALKVYVGKRVPLKSYIYDGMDAVQRVCNELKSRSGIIDRTFLGGSVGKKTAADSWPDFDVVVFVNNHEPPFTSVLNHFKKILKSSHVLPDLKILGKTEYSLKLKFLGYDIDLLPAANFVSNLAQPGKSPVRDARQALEALKKIQSDPETNSYAYSTSLEETQIRFPKEQDEFEDDLPDVWALVRLCKAWNKSIPKMGYISGQSTLIELIAMHVAQEGTVGSLVTGFEKFLRLMVNFQHLAIDFGFDPVESIRVLGETRWQPCVPRRVKSRPFVLEPANPFNNLAAGVEEEQAVKFQWAANVTLTKLRP